MKFPSRNFSLKSGHQVVIRTLNPDEAQALINLKRAYISDTSTIPLTLEEYPDDKDRESKLIERYNSSQNGILLVAEFEGELIGNIDLTGSQRIKMQHTGMIGMGIKEKWRNKGLGRIFIESVIDWAKNNTELELIWLDVYATNELGYNLYKNTGFKISGVIKDFFKEENGYKDKIQMYLDIRR